MEKNYLHRNDIYGRGMGNNNPGFIKLTDAKLAGKIPNAENTDGEYEQFISIVFGLRALLGIVSKKLGKLGYSNLLEVAANHLGPGEEATKKAELLSSIIGVEPDEPLDASEKTILDVSRAIMQCENISLNRQHITQRDLQVAWKVLAMQKKPRKKGA